MSDSGEPAPFEDINKAVREDWEAETTPYERIRAVIRHTYTPTAADAVADAACTSPKTARKHLTTLAEEGFVDTEPGEHGGTLYQRSAESLVVEQAANILSELSTAELRDRITELREQLVTYRREYGVESPEELAVERTNEFFEGAESTVAAPDPETIRDWQTIRRNLAYATTALSVANAQQVIDTDSSDANPAPSF